MKKEIEKIIEKISKLADKYGYSQISERDYEDFLGTEEEEVNTIKLFADIKDPHKNTWVCIYECDKHLAVSYYYYSGPSGAWDSLETWAKEEAWTDMINFDL